MYGYRRVGCMGGWVYGYLSGLTWFFRCLAGPLWCTSYPNPFDHRQIWCHCILVGVHAGHSTRRACVRIYVCVCVSVSVRVCFRIYECCLSLSVRARVHAVWSNPLDIRPSLACQRH